MKRSSILVLVFFLISTFGFGQDSAWTLQKCINYAIANNIQVKQSQNNALIAQSELTQSKFSTLPSVSGFASNKYNFGQTVDPFTNKFATNQVRSNTFALSANMNLFNGFQHINTIKKNRFQYIMDQYQTQKIKNDIALNVAAAFLQILYSKELLASAQEQSKQTGLQKDRISQLVDAGSLSQDNLLDIEAQLASDNYNVVTAQNQLTMAYLSMRQLLLLPYNKPFDVQAPNVDVASLKFPAVGIDSLYKTASDTLPQVKVAEYSYDMAQRDLAIARGGRSPQLNFSASYGSGYSGAQTEVTNTTLSGETLIGATSGGEAVYAPDFTYQTRVKPFNDQLNDNINKSIGFTLSIPIFNGWSVESNITRAKIGLDNAQLSVQSAKQDLMKSIQQAYTDALAAQGKYKAAHQQYVAKKLAFQYTQQKFDAGAINSVDYNNAKTLMNNAESTYIQAKYDYIFKLKVLDFYQGKPITLK